MPSKLKYTKSNLKIGNYSWKKLRKQNIRLKFFFEKVKEKGKSLIESSELDYDIIVKTFKSERVERAGL